MRRVPKPRSVRFFQPFIQSAALLLFALGTAPAYADGKKTLAVAEEMLDVCLDSALTGKSIEPSLRKHGFREKKRRKYWRYSFGSPAAGAFGRGIVVELNPPGYNSGCQINTNGLFSHAHADHIYKDLQAQVKQAGYKVSRTTKRSVYFQKGDRNVVVYGIAGRPFIGLRVRSFQVE